jgi:23S rRNA (uracil1939-C5)-methyltransferase
VQYARQLDYKRAQVEEALVRIGGLDRVTVRDTMASDHVFGYRNKMEFSFSDRRWLLPEEMASGQGDIGFALGLHVPGTFHKVLDIDRCLIQTEAGNPILRTVKQMTRESGIPAYGLKSHRGFWRFLVLRHSSAHDEWMVNLVTATEDSRPVAPIAKALTDRFEKIRTVIQTVNPRKAAVALGEKEVVLFGEGRIEDRVGPYRFRISAGSFFQTNSAGAERLYRVVGKYADLGPRDRVLDLYSGTGTIPIFLSDQAAEIVGIEIVEGAVRDAVTNCDINRVGNCRFLQGDIREMLHRVQRVPDVMIIDPPRAGMHKDVLKAVSDMGTDRMVYISCNPTTMARDIGLLARQYEVVEIQPVDMFPHTYHIECVAKMVRR